MQHLNLINWLVTSGLVAQTGGAIRRVDAGCGSSSMGTLSTLPDSGASGWPNKGNSAEGSFIA